MSSGLTVTNDWIETHTGREAEGLFSEPPVTCACFLLEKVTRITWCLSSKVNVNLERGTSLQSINRWVGGGEKVKEKKASLELLKSVQVRGITVNE